MRINSSVNQCKMSNRVQVAIKAENCKIYINPNSNSGRSSSSNYEEICHISSPSSRNSGHSSRSSHGHSSSSNRQLKEYSKKSSYSSNSRAISGSLAPGSGSYSAQKYHISSHRSQRSAVMAQQQISSVSGSGYQKVSYASTGSGAPAAAVTYVHYQVSYLIASWLKLETILIIIFFQYSS